MEQLAVVLGGVAGALLVGVVGSLVDPQSVGLPVADRVASAAGLLVLAGVGLGLLSGIALLVRQRAVARIGSPVQLDVMQGTQAAPEEPIYERVAAAYRTAFDRADFGPQREAEE